MTADRKELAERVEPCPFCASSETFVCECEDGTAGCSTFWVECDGCSAQGSVSEYKSGAVLYWNKATPASPMVTDTEVEKFRSALERIALLDEADGYELTWEHASRAVGIASTALGKHPSEINWHKHYAATASPMVTDALSKIDWRARGKELYLAHQDAAVVCAFVEGAHAVISLLHKGSVPPQTTEGEV